MAALGVNPSDPRMPARHRTRQILGAFAIAASFLLTGIPRPAFALDPPRPLPGYKPVFVTEREPGVWEDCTWAASSMLLDKWTSGMTIVDRERLRELSGDLEGGSNLADVKRAFASLGISLQTSPQGGDSVTWPELLGRLGHGGGAILLGDYGQLPRVYARWDPSFWQNEGVLDDHALYLDRYDRRTGRILVMDPLAPAGWGGEWIPVSALKRYAWRTPGGALWTAVTPAALAAPFEGVDLGDPVASADSSAVRVSWPIERAPEGWAYAGASVTAQIAAATDVDLTDGVVSALPLNEFLPPPPAPSSDVADGWLAAAIPLPAPGVYDVRVTLTDERFGRQVVAAGPFTLYVPGRRAARYSVPDDLLVAPGALAHLAVAITNVGSESWADPTLVGSLPLDLQPPRNTRLVGTWLPAHPIVDLEDRGATLVPPPIDFGPFSLEPGYSQLIDTDITAPADPGYWRLVVDVVDDEVGSFALKGSAPGVIVVEVFAPGEDARNQ
jgi:hypothetical protein